MILKLNSLMKMVNQNFGKNNTEDVIDNARREKSTF